MLRNGTLLAFSTLLSLSLSAQISTGGMPYGLRTGLELSPVPSVHGVAFDAVAVAEEDARRAAAGQIPAYSRVLPVHAGLDDAGEWRDLPNGDRLWRLQVISDGALATELYFSDLFMPVNASLYVYSPDGRHVLGGFTAFNNSEDGRFATVLIPGEASVVEYYEPHAVRGEGRVRVASVGHAYRDVDDVAGASDFCEVDVNCSEGANWTEQRDATVRVGIVDGGVGAWCSGALVNNVEQDCKPYFLTAQHCGDGTSASDFNLWKFYFNYEKSGCGSGSSTSSHSVVGCTKRGASNDGGGDSGSDFLLLEANNATIPSGYHPYWAGWDASGSGSSGGVCIHHPAGDRKKISTFIGNTSSNTWGGVPNTHWRVGWSATANGHGVTEGGSSGSPLFNSNHRIIGTLTGGGSSCTNTNFPDYFGKVSYHWQSNPGPTSTRLKNWLDPQSTGTLILDGSYDPCGMTVGVAEPMEAPLRMEVHPNPATDGVVVALPEEMKPNGTLEVRDMGGRLVATMSAGSSSTARLDTSPLESGAYLLRLLGDGKLLATAPLIVVHH
ncbi:MAG: T9SS type A sorting domain-containing protein [Flavobacteriales bacterium]|nr:T9SS type A sorting domain-containing protein [Flavobacteriales bacterium]